MSGHSFFNGRLGLYIGDITEQAVDAIVNAANSSLLGGGGVDGAIHRRGGETLTAACRQLRATSHPDGLPAGQVVITTGGNLPAKWVIHTVGPIYGQHGGHEAQLLVDCYRNALLLAREKGLKTIAFPAISTGVYGYPPAAAAQVVGSTLRAFLAEDTQIEEIRLVFFKAHDLQEFLAHWQ
ncbi:MAG: Appr-p processing [Proteobacteria bacterium]|nr:Appr-p processing [Pseudomonadota bacterium]